MVAADACDMSPAHTTVGSAAGGPSGRGAEPPEPPTPTTLPQRHGPMVWVGIAMVALQHLLLLTIFDLLDVDEGRRSVYILGSIGFTAWFLQLWRRRRRALVGASAVRVFWPLATLLVAPLATGALWLVAESQPTTPRTALYDLVDDHCGSFVERANLSSLIEYDGRIVVGGGLVGRSHLKGDELTRTLESRFDGDTLLIDEILCYRGADSCQPNELRLHRRGEDDPIATGTWQSCSGSRGVREAIATTAEFQAMIEAIFSG